MPIIPALKKLKQEDSHKFKAKTGLVSKATTKAKNLISAIPTFPIQAEFSPLQNY